jgi:hypothetical protein
MASTVEDPPNVHSDPKKSLDIACISSSVDAKLPSAFFILTMVFLRFVSRSFMEELGI